MKRADLTEKILDIKREKGWGWRYICDQIGGMSEVLIVGAPLGTDEAGTKLRQRVPPSSSVFPKPSRRCSTKSPFAAPARRCRRPIR